MSELNQTENQNENNSIPRDQRATKEINEYNKFNSLLHLSGVFNLLVPVSALMCALFYHVSFNERWPQIRQETRKVLSFSILEFLAVIVFFLLPLPSMFMDFGLFQIGMATVLLTGLAFMVRIMIAIVYFKQFQRAKVGRTTKYPLRQLALGGYILRFVESIFDNADEDEKTEGFTETRESSKK